MNLPQAIDDLWTSLVGGTRSAFSCFSGRGEMLQCHEVWVTAIWGIIVIAVVVLLFAVRHFLRDYLRHRAAVKRWQADQRVASDEELDQVKWRGDRPETETRSQEELALQIKQALQANKDGNKAG